MLTYSVRIVGRYYVWHDRWVVIVAGSDTAAPWLDGVYSRVRHKPEHPFQSLRQPGLWRYSGGMTLQFHASVAAESH